MARPRVVARLYRSLDLLEEGTLLDVELVAERYYGSTRLWGVTRRLHNALAAAAAVPSPEVRSRVADALVEAARTLPGQVRRRSGTSYVSSLVATACEYLSGTLDDDGAGDARRAPSRPAIVSLPGNPHAA